MQDDHIDPTSAKLEERYDFLKPFLFSPNGTRIIQIQPTRLCNLRCTHCYTESGPDQHGELDLEMLERFLTEAGSLGYRYVGISGGEPLLWAGLEDFLSFAKDAGFATSITTNGTLLDADRVKRLGGRADLVAVSVDGPPEEHAAMRGGSKKVFELMRNGLSALNWAGVPFVLTFTLTRFNADRLSWLYEFADKVGALGINVHPLCDHGAASTNLPNAIPDSLEFKVSSWLLALLIEQKGGGGPAVTLDAVQRKIIEESSWPILKGNEVLLRASSFSDLVPALIIEPDGCVVPFIYGFPRIWSIGYIGHGHLHFAADEWRERCAFPVSKIVRATLRRLDKKKSEYIDLFGEILASAKLSGLGFKNDDTGGTLKIRDAV